MDSATQFQSPLAHSATKGAIQFGVARHIQVWNCDLPNPNLTSSTDFSESEIIKNYYDYYEVRAICRANACGMHLTATPDPKRCTLPCTILATRAMKARFITFFLLLVEYIRFIPPKIHFWMKKKIVLANRALNFPETIFI